MYYNLQYMEHQLSPGVFRALCLSVGEELKAAADYRDRALQGSDDEAIRIWGHIMCEELKHAAMQIAKLAKDDNEFAAYLYEYMNADDILAVEEQYDEQPS